MTYPTTPGFESIEITDNEAVLLSESIDLSTNARSLNGQRWEITGKHPVMTRTEAAAIMAYIKSQRGSSGTFDLILPEYSDANGTISGSLTVNNASGEAIGQTSITVDHITGTILAGDFIKFANHNKVYMVTEGLSGESATLSLDYATNTYQVGPDIVIYPPLRSAVSDNEAITYDSVPFKVRLSSSKNGMSINPSNQVGLKVDFIEAT